MGCDLSIIDPVATNNATNKGNIMQSPMLKKINHIAAMRADDTLLCIACGIVFATLTMAFII